MPKTELTQEEIDELTKDSEKPPGNDAKSFLLMTQKGPKGSVLDVKPLWDNYYRLNFWLAQKSDNIMQKSIIAESRFVRVDPKKKGKGFTVKDLTRKGLWKNSN